MRILAVDPGGTTGYATGNTYDPYVSMSCGQIPGGLEAAMDQLHNWFTLVRNSHEQGVVVLERFVIGERTIKASRQTDALEIIGALKTEARRNGFGWVLQSAGDAKNLFTDDRLKRFGWYAVGQEHARDAIRHLGLYLAKNRHISLTGGPSGNS